MSKSKTLASKTKVSSVKAKDAGNEIVNCTGVWWTLSEEGCVIANDDPCAKELLQDVEGYGHLMASACTRREEWYACVVWSVWGVLFFHFLFWGCVWTLRA